MDPAVAALDFAKAGVIVANMIESYLAAGALPPNPEGADNVEHQDCRSSSDAARLHLYPYALSTRKSAGLMMRKLSVTESQKTAQFFGTSSRRKRRTELQKSL